MTKKKKTEPNNIKNRKIYVYSSKNYPDSLKVGQTNGDVSNRIQKQHGASAPDIPWKLELEVPAYTDKGKLFSDKKVHQLLKERGIVNLDDGGGTEWFICDIEDVIAAIKTIKTGVPYFKERIQDFRMRPEQQQAVEKAYYYFKENKENQPRFLWNAKMRFGKTFATYQLAKKMKWNRILIITFMLDVKDSWRNDLQSHIDFDGWNFFDLSNLKSEPKLRDDSPTVYFSSVQNLFLKNGVGIKEKNEWIHKEMKWDAIIIDECHFGIDKEKTLEILENLDSNHLLYLSGTPFKFLEKGRFTDEQIFTWSYIDEQKAKKNWNNSNGANPYQALPTMKLFTYEMPDDLKEYISDNSSLSFNLSEFFKTVNKGENASFVYKKNVQKWLDFIRGQSFITLKKEKSGLPYDDFTLNHTLWVLPNTSACYAMKNLLKEERNIFYHDYEIIVASGKENKSALNLVKQETMYGTKSKSITLTCQRLTTGVTIKEWTGVFMLHNSESLSSYLQTAFRVQSPWVIKDEIIKKECFVFDFSPYRALKTIVNLYETTSKSNSSALKNIDEFINFFPVLAYDGYEMKQINSKQLLDTLFASAYDKLSSKGWESSLLIRDNNLAFKEIINNEQIMSSLASLGTGLGKKKDADNIKVNDSPIRQNKTVNNKGQLSSNTSNETEKLTEDMVKEKLRKLTMLIPIFMYLTDEKEQSIDDLLIPENSELFEYVTNLSTSDFKYLRELEVFSEILMNKLIEKFYEIEKENLSYYITNQSQT